MKNQSAFFTLRISIGLSIILGGLFLALLGFGAFPASPTSNVKTQQKGNIQKADANPKSAIQRPPPPELICADDGICVQTYDSFDTDLTNFLARRDNTIRLVDTTKKNRLINTMKSFAGSIGIPRLAIRQQANGRWYGKTLIDGEIDAYYKQDAEPDLRSSCVLKARKTTRYRTAVSPISDDQLKLIADQTIAQWHVPILVPGEALLFASEIHTREADDDTTGPLVINERVGYYRTFPGRQVINSSLKVEIDPSTSLAAGLSLRAFWPLQRPQSTTLKQFDALKGDVLKALHKNGSKSLTLNVTSCSATYYQTPAALIPSITCSGEFIDSVSGLRDDTAEGVSVDVSLATSYSLDEADEMSVYTSTYPDDSHAGGMQRPDSCAERSGFAFHAYYVTSDNRFYDGAKEFYDDFKSSLREGNLGLAWHDSRFVDTPCDQYGADWSDLIYIGTHGAPRHFLAENEAPLDEIFTAANDSDPDDVADLTELGNGDAEYVINTACSTASTIYCDGRTAISRYTEQSDYHSIFHGLHIYCSHHGTFINSNSDRHITRAKDLSEYLIDGLTIIESWEDADDDVQVYNILAPHDCGEMIDPENSCDFTTPWNNCARWSGYASSFYQEGKDNITLYNRGGSNSHDVDPGDPDYDIDVRYQTESDSVPIYSPGHPLP